MYVQINLSQLKQITTYDGFSSVTYRPIHLHFDF
jgi:hypothetical protein